MADPYPLSDLFKYGAGFTTTGAPDPETQYFLNKGYIAGQSTNDAGQTTYSYMGSQIPAAQLGNGQTAAFGSFWSPQGISGTARLRDPNAVAKVTNFGDITPLANMIHPEDTDFMSRYFPAIAMAALTAGAGGAIGAVGGGSGLFGPGSLLGRTPSLGNTVGNLFSPSTPSAPATTANPNAGGLIALLQMLGLLRGG